MTGPDIREAVAMADAARRAWLPKLDAKYRTPGGDVTWSDLDAAEQGRWHAVVSAVVALSNGEEGRLRAALEPFAKAADRMERFAPDDGVVFNIYSHLEPPADNTVGQFRAARSAFSQSPLPDASPGEDDEAKELLEIADRDGYERAVQDIDLLTGGDGEYRASTDPDRHTPDAEAMKRRIVDRFAALSSSPPQATSSEVERLRAEADAAIIAAAHALVMEPGGLRMTPSGTYIVEKADKSDPHYRLCEAFDARAALAQQGEKT